MCITFVYIDESAIGDQSRYQLILLNNRDESYDRPTSFAHWDIDILAGRDEQDLDDRGGTWLGMRKDGTIGVLLSMLEKQRNINPLAPSRGNIINAYLRSNASAEEFCHHFTKEADKYNRFSLLLLDRIANGEGKKVYRVVNFVSKQNSNSIQIIGPGIHGFGNSETSKPFKKIAHGLRLFETKLNEFKDGYPSRERLYVQLISILSDRTSHHPDEEIIGRSDYNEKCCEEMSKLFYTLPSGFRYGTRSHTVIMVNGVGHATYFEKSMISPSPECAQWIDSMHDFDIED